MISIHAPPRGATRSPSGISRRTDFNSRPSARGDVRRRCHARCTCDFNSRPSARGDHAGHRERLAARISIHAPPRGATSRSSTGWTTAYFNSRPSARGDEFCVIRATDKSVFQFTPLREGRLVPENVSLLREHFNSRPSARGDPSYQGLDGHFSISIHAPPRGATSCRHATLYPSPTFQFTPLREGRPMVNAQYLLDVIFQFTPLREGRPNKERRIKTMKNFNSRPSARGDERRRCAYRRPVLFQFTPLREGRQSCL